MSAAPRLLAVCAGRAAPLLARDVTAAAVAVASGRKLGATSESWGANKGRDLRT